MAASKVLVWEDPARIDKVGHLIFPDGQNRGRGAGALDRGQFDREEEVLWPDGCAAMYRKSMLDRDRRLRRGFLRLRRRRRARAPRAHRRLALPLCARRRRAPPSRLDPGQGLGRAAGADRAQSRAAGAKALSRGACCGSIRCSSRLRIAAGAADGRPRRRRHRPLPGTRRQMVDGRRADPRRPAGPPPGARACSASAPRSTVSASSRPREVRRLILDHRLPLREVA